MCHSNDIRCVFDTYCWQFSHRLLHNNVICGSLLKINLKLVPNSMTDLCVGAWNETWHEEHQVLMRCRGYDLKNGMSERQWILDLKVTQSERENKTDYPISRSARPPCWLCPALTICVLRIYSRWFQIFTYFLQMVVLSLHSLGSKMVGCGRARLWFNSHQRKKFLSAVTVMQPPA
jgi:hypothetical protein